MQRSTFRESPTIFFEEARIFRMPIIVSAAANALRVLALWTIPKRNAPVDCSTGALFSVMSRSRDQNATVTPVSQVLSIV
jgi:hypothetical protein